MSKARELAKAVEPYRRTPILFNSQFHVWQRGANFTSIVNNQYCADRWKSSYDGSGGVYDIVRNNANADMTTMSASPYYARLTCTTAPTGQTYNRFRQILPSVRMLAGTTITVSAVLRANTSPVTLPEIQFVQYFGTGGSPSSTVFTTVTSSAVIATSIARYSWSVTVPTVTGKTIGSNKDDLVYLSFGLPLNATYSLDVFSVQVDIGDVALEIPELDFNSELQRCQHFYQHSYDYGTYPGATTSIGSNAKFKSSTVATTEVREFQARFPVPMRTTPTMTWYSPATGTAARVRQVDGGAADVTVSSTSEATSGSTGWPALSTGIADTYRVSAHWAADAEL